jgi:hypothetical protein
MGTRDGVKGRVNFFIIGVQKGGTTALAAYLRQHPGVQLSRAKEPHHFDDEIRVDWSAPEHDRLHRQFDWSVEGVIRGEATPIYVYWPQALLRLQRYNPKAKIILGLRHPAFRAFSHWRMERTRGRDHLPFEQAISNAGRFRVREAPRGVHRVYSYIERGFYARQVERLFRLFPRGQTHFFRTDHLWDNPGGTLTAIERFLGVETVLAAKVLRQFIAPVESSDSDVFSAAARAVLNLTFREDIKRTAELTQLDLTDWLNEDYREPMEAPRRNIARQSPRSDREPSS